MKKFLSLLILVLAMVYAENDKPVTISGTVKDKATGNVLTGLQVFIKSDKLELTTVTDRYGRFIQELPKGKYNITFTYFAHQDSTIKDISIDGTKENRLDVALNIVRSSKREFSNRDGVVLSSMKSSEIMDASMGAMSVDGAEADPLMPASSSGRGAGRIEKMTASSPGVISSGKGYSVKEAKTDGKEIVVDVDSKSLSAFEDVSAGRLTSGEVNDFRKWNLWNDLTTNDLNQYRINWSFQLRDRFTVQLMSNENTPAVDYPVKLFSPNGEELWAGRSDNTGKVELWANVYNDDYKDLDQCYITVENGENIRRIDNIKQFRKGINTVKLDAQCKVPDALDIVFAVDATGSMGDEINYLKAELKDIIGKIKDKYKDLKVNLGSIFYRDVMDEYIIRKGELSPDIDETVNFIADQSADGGGDFEEAVEMALQTAVNDMNWSKNAVSRIMFLILDAPPHNNETVKAKLKEITARASIMGIRIIPVTCSGIDKSTEYLMRSLALATNGSYVFLTDDSGIGGKHLKPSTDKYDVEKMNELFIRLIDQFTAVPPCAEITRLNDMIDKDNIYDHNDAKAGESNPKYEEIMNMVKCFPNPSMGDISIEINGKVDELYLVDLTGKVLQKFENLNIGVMNINLRDYPTGIYYFKYRVDKYWHGHKVMLYR